MNNMQPIEKQELDVNGSLTVHSIFYTLQGEGIFCGHPAVFVRLSGCNLQCPSCDTDYTSVNLHMSAMTLAKQVERRHAHVNHKPIVVITGGEPFRQNIAPFVRILVNKGYKVQIETNGTLFIEDMPWDSIWVICSPKAGKIAKLLEPHIDAYKYVMSADSVDLDDGLPILALDHTAKPKVARPVAIEGKPAKPIYLQPMDADDTHRNALNRNACIDSCMKHGYLLQLQIHKIIGVD